MRFSVKFTFVANSYAIATICWKGYPSSFEILLCLWQKQFGYTFWSYLWIVYSLPLIYVFICQSHSLDYCSNIVRILIIPPNVFFIFKTVLALLVPLFCTFILVWSLLMEHLAEILISITLNLYINLESSLHWVFHSTQMSLNLSTFSLTFFNQYSVIFSM